jgi:SAM-dependent methyltransferase
MLFIKEYKAKKIKSPDIFNNRKRIIKSKNPNLIYLLNKRFSWMKEFLKKKKVIIELGSGNGCLKKIIKKKNIILTDIIKYPWINKKVDMLKVNLGKKYYNKVDVFIINHSLHHCANPGQTLKKMSRYLKKGGHILINEPETSFALKLVQILLDDESWSLRAKVFNTKKNLFNPKNPWISNTAIAQLLFKDAKKFNHYFPQYIIKKNNLSEFFIFLNSGGVNSNFFFIKLNFFFLNIVDFMDKFFIYLFPNIFAFNRTIVLEKINDNK